MCKNRKASLKNILPEHMKRFTVEGAMVKRGICLNLVFQKSIWTFKIRIIKHKKKFYIMSETSATSIWRNFYFQKYQLLHWLLWQQLYLEIKCSISSPKLINQQNHSSSPGDGYEKRQRKDKSVLFCFVPHTILEVPSSLGHKILGEKSVPVEL